MNEITTDLKSMKKSSPHVLIELSEIEWKRVKDNCIHLDGFSVQTSNKVSTVLWEKVTIGKNLRLKKKSNCNDGFHHYKEIDLNRTKSNMLMITALKNECQTYIPSLIVSSSVNNIKPSGKVVLLTTVFKKINSSEKVWSIDDFNMIKKSKPNILKSNTHFNSNGFYASFGNKGSFEKNEQSSVGQYTNKRSSSSSKQFLIDVVANEYERFVADDISRCTNDLSSILPKIKTIISPIISTAYELQSSIRNINIKEGYASHSGCWQTSICMDATTGQFHTEKDCTYTLISIPNQNTITKQSAAINYHFLFSLSNKIQLNIPLYPGISFIFSAAFLTHRQHINEYDKSNENERFFNVASYGNKRLYHHIKKSFNKSL